MTTLNQTHKGRTVRFASKASTDATVWKGRVEAVALTYDIARSFSDVEAYNALVRRYDAAVPVAANSLNYFLVRLDTEGQPVRAFAEEWLAANTFEVLDEKTELIIKVYDFPEADHANILTVLRAGGYTAVFA